MCSNVSKPITAYPGHTSDGSGNGKEDMDLGAMDCLIKPLQIEELIEKINKAIQRRGANNFHH